MAEDLDRFAGVSEPTLSSGKGSCTSSSLMCRKEIETKEGIGSSFRALSIALFKTAAVDSSPIVHMTMFFWPTASPATEAANLEG